MSNYPVHPAVLAGIQAADAATGDMQKRMRENAAEANRAFRAASYQNPLTTADIKDNPWSAATWNLTRQSMLLRNDPARAAAMRAAAGLEHHGSVVSQDTARTAERIALAEAKLATLPQYSVQLARHHVAQFHRKPAKGRGAELIAAVAERIRQDDATFRAVSLDGSPLHDWNGNALVEMTVDRLPAHLAETMPELFDDETPAAPAGPVTAPKAGRPLHERVAAAQAQGPAAVAALRAELGMKR